MKAPIYDAGAQGCRSLPPTPPSDGMGSEGCRSLVPLVMVCMGGQGCRSHRLNDGPRATESATPKQT